MTTTTTTMHSSIIMATSLSSKAPWNLMPKFLPWTPENFSHILLHFVIDSSQVPLNALMWEKLNEGYWSVGNWAAHIVKGNNNFLRWKWNISKVINFLLECLKWFSHSLIPLKETSSQCEIIFSRVGWWNQWNDWLGCAFWILCLWIMDVD